MKISRKIKVMLAGLVSVLLLSVGVALAYYVTEHNHGEHWHDTGGLVCLNGDNYWEYHVYEHIYAHTYADDGTFISEGLSHENFLRYDYVFHSDGPCL